MRTILFCALALGLSLHGAAFAATKDLGGGFRDHGVATPISQHRGTVATVDGQGRPVVLSWLMDCRGGYELLLVDAETGKTEEFPMPFPKGDSPFASLLSKANKFYTHFGSHFIEFDPVRRAITFCRKTAPQMAMSMTEDEHGLIWSATYPQSGLACYDPQSGTLTDYGQLYKQDWAEYPRSVAVDDTGWVYLGVGSTACQILAFDPKANGSGTGSKGRTAVPLVPEDQRKHGSGAVYRATDGKVYGQPNVATPGWCMLYRGQMTSLDKKPGAAAMPIITGSQGLFHTVFPDGKRIKTFDLLNRTLAVEDPKTKTANSVHFEYQSEGAAVMGVAASPDGTICGGTAFPMRFFAYDPKNDQWVNRMAFGQWNTVARQGDHFFAGVYSAGGLVEWDPAAPWVDTVAGKQGCNPRLLVQAATTIIRPSKLLAHPDGHTLVLAGTPGYGLTGGGLLFWDRATSTHVLLTHQDLLPEHSTESLVALPNAKLLGGSTTSPGTGGLRKAEQAELYLLDLATKRITWHAPVFPGAQGYQDLCLGPDGLVWGVVDAKRFFVFDPASKKVVHEEETIAKFGRPVSQQGPRIFVFGPDKATFMLFNKGVARIDPRGWQISLVAKSPVTIGSGGDYLDGRIYFSLGSHVYSYQLPEGGRKE